MESPPASLPLSGGPSHSWSTPQNSAGSLRCQNSMMWPSSICFGSGLATITPWISQTPRDGLERRYLPVSGKFPVPSRSQPSVCNSAGPAQLTFVYAGYVQFGASRAPTRVHAPWAPTRVCASERPRESAAARAPWSAMASWVPRSAMAARAPRSAMAPESPDPPWLPERAPPWRPPVLCCLRVPWGSRVPPPLPFGWLYGVLCVLCFPLLSCPYLVSSCSCPHLWLSVPQPCVLVN